MATVLERVIAPAKRQPDAGTVQWFRDCVERGKRSVFSETKLVTPGLAAELLKLNPDNRNIRPTKAGQFAADMRSGKWTFNGEPIIISDDGLINDGQHRLSAIIDANTPVLMLFVFGVARAARFTVDQGAARAAGDYLSMEGVQNANACAAIARLVIAIEREGGQRLYREGEVTNAEIRSRVATDPAIGEAAHYAATVYRFTSKFAATGIVGTAFYLLNEVSPVEARDYMDRVCIGEGLRRVEPAFAVRDTLFSLGKGQRGKKLEAIFRGWVKYRCGQPLKQVKVLGNFPALV